jgi:hypothetical protein
MHVARHRSSRGAAPRVLRGELDRRQPGAEKVGFESDDDCGLVEAVVRQHRPLEAGLVCVSDGCVRHRLVDHVAKIRVALRPARQDVSRRWAGERAGEQHHASLRRERRSQPRLDLVVHLFPRDRRAEPQRPWQPPAVIERQHGRLTHRAGTAAEERRFGIALDLDGAAVPGLYEHAAGRRAAGAGRRVPVGDARREILGGGHERDRLLGRTAGASGCAEAESHERQKIAA